MKPMLAFGSHKVHFWDWARYPRHLRNGPAYRFEAQSRLSFQVFGDGSRNIPNRKPKSNFATPAESAPFPG